METQNGLPPHGVGDPPGALSEESPRVRVSLGDFGVTATNLAFGDLVGRDPRSVVGRPLHELWPEALAAYMRTSGLDREEAIRRMERRRQRGRRRSACMDAIIG